MAKKGTSSKSANSPSDEAKKAAAAPSPGRPSALLDTRVIYCGDNLEQLAKLPERCIDLIYIDPPFNSKTCGCRMGKSQIMWRKFLRNSVLCIALTLAGCTMQARMVNEGYPADYVDGYLEGRGAGPHRSFQREAALFKQGLADGEHDKAAGIKGDPPPPKLEIPARE